MLLQNWWYTTLLGLPATSFPPLEGHHKAQVVIVGAGAAGLSVALTLSESISDIIVLEKNICGGSSTGKSAGFLTPDSELELSQLLRRYGPQGAQDLWSVATRGVDMIVDRVRHYNLDCDLQKQDSLFLGNSRSGWKEALAEVKARETLGFTHKVYSQETLPRIIGSQAYHGGVRYSETYGINALRYSQGLKHVLASRGVRIYESSEVYKIDDHRLETHLGSVTADQIIFCADKIKPAVSHYSDHIYHAQTFVSISEPLTPLQQRYLFPEGPLQCWDSDLVYTYFRMTGDHRLLLGGGSKWTVFSRHDVHSPYVMFQVIKRFLKKFPGLKDLKFIQYWPGRIDTTRDLIPTIVKDEKRPWIHYVLGCVGLPWATFCGDFVARQILEKREDDQKYYRYFRPERRFLFPVWLEAIMGKELLFSLNNFWAKYYQVDQEFL